MKYNLASTFLYLLSIFVIGLAHMERPGEHQLIRQILFFVNLAGICHNISWMLFRQMGDIKIETEKDRKIRLSTHELSRSVKLLCCVFSQASEAAEASKKYQKIFNDQWLITIKNKVNLSCKSLPNSH